MILKRVWNRVSQFFAGPPVFLVNYKHIEGLGYDFVVLNNGKEYLSVKIGGRLSVNSTVLWRTLSMLINKWIEAGIDILRVLFTLYIFSVF